MIKTLNKFGIMGAHLNIIKAVHDKFTVNIVLNGETFSSKIRNKTRMSTFTTLIQHSIEVLATEIR